MPNIEITSELVTKILDTISHGLVSGLGDPKPGEMCVEAAICYSLGLPHSDNPPCVGIKVREAKIALNDQQWESSKARADGMKYIAIAQLGSDTIDQEKFKQELFKQRNIIVIAKTFDWIPIEKQLPEHEELKQLVLKCFDIVELKNRFKDNYYYYNYYNYNNYYYDYDYYGYGYSYYYNHNYNYFQEFLLLDAQAILETLKILKSPGCEFLHLVK